MSKEQIDSINDLENYSNNTQSGDSDKTYLTKEQKKNKEFKPSQKEEVIRFLEYDVDVEKSTNRFFDKALFHDVKVGEYKSKVYCNKNDGLPCPLCEKAEKILSKKFSKDDPKGKENYKLGKSWEAREYHIFKLLDKGAIAHGVKFWRTSVPYNRPSILSKILDGNKQFFRNNDGFVDDNGEKIKIEYISPKHGCDMSVNSVHTSIPNRPAVKYWDISSISPYNMKPSSILPSDKKKEEEVLKEIVSWKLIFNKFEIKDVITAEEYLQLCADGNAPYWDASNKTFQFPNHPELGVKYAKVKAERQASHNNNDEHDNNDSEDSLEDIEKKYSSVVDTKKGIEDMSDQHEDDVDDEDDLPF